MPLLGRPLNQIMPAIMEMIGALRRRRRIRNCAGFGEENMGSKHRVGAFLGACMNAEFMHLALANDCGN